MEEKGFLGGEMSFWDHLDELRKILFRIVAFAGVVSVVLFIYVQHRHGATKAKSLSHRSVTKSTTNFLM
jgi:Sec-independent protein secretion pathway component TatC